MEPFIIVGGGLSGITVATVLTRRNIAFVGVEKLERLGERHDVGHPRVHHPDLLNTFTSFFGQIEWNEIAGAAKERKAGGWIDAADGANDFELSYMKVPFYQPSVSYERLIDKMVLNVVAQFKLRAEVTEVLPDSKTIKFRDGSSMSYSKIVWCADLPSLAKAWKGESGALGKILKKAEEGYGGIHFELELSEELFPAKNTLVFPFRFKDKKLRALGVSYATPADSKAPVATRWLFFLEKETIENREEVAKYIRSLKRELFKEFPRLKEILVSERIIFVPAIYEEKPISTDSLEILPDLFYVGPQLSSKKTESDLRNLDLILSNCKQLEVLLDGISSSHV